MLDIYYAPPAALFILLLISGFQAAIEKNLYKNENASLFFYWGDKSSMSLLQGGLEAKIEIHYISV